MTILFFSPSSFKAMNLNKLISSKHTHAHFALPKQININNIRRKNAHFMRTKPSNKFYYCIGNRNCKLRAPFDHSIFRWHQASSNWMVGYRTTDDKRLEISKDRSVLSPLNYVAYVQYKTQNRMFAGQPSLFFLVFVYRLIWFDFFWLLLLLRFSIWSYGVFLYRLPSFFNELAFRVANDLHEASNPCMPVCLGAQCVQCILNNNLCVFPLFFHSFQSIAFCVCENRKIKSINNKTKPPNQPDIPIHVHFYSFHSFVSSIYKWNSSS